MTSSEGDPELDARVARARAFLQISAASRLPLDQQAQLEELLTRDWDGRGLAGEVGRRLLTLARNFERWDHPMRDIDPRGERLPPTTEGAIVEPLEKNKTPAEWTEALQDWRPGEFSRELETTFQETPLGSAQALRRPESPVSSPGHPRGQA